MQLLSHVVFYVSIKLCAMHSIGIILKGSGAELSCAWVPGGDNAPSEGALVVGSGTVVMGMVSSKAPAADLPQRAVIFIMVGGLFVAFEAIGEWGGRAGALMLMSGQVANTSLWHSTTLEAIPPIF